MRATFAEVDDAEARLLAALDTSDGHERILALRGLVRREAMDEARWTRVLSDDDVELRREALELWAHYPLDERSVTSLVVGLLRDGDALVADAAAFALGEHLALEAVDELCRVAREHEDPRCRESAIGALGALGDERARATVIAALEDKPSVRRRAVVALANFEGPDVDAALAAAAEDRDWQVRAAVDQLRQAEQP